MTFGHKYSCELSVYFPKNILIICNFIYLFKMSFFFLSHPVYCIYYVYYIYVCMYVCVCGGGGGGGCLHIKTYVIVCTITVNEYFALCICVIIFPVMHT